MGSSAQSPAVLFERRDLMWRGGAVVVCALVARAVMVGDTLWPRSPDERAAAGQEGWIHLPGTDLAALRH